MRALALLLTACLTVACGRADDLWIVDLRGPTGLPVACPDTFFVVLFEPTAAPRQVLHSRTYPGSPRLPPLAAGYYELWVPGYRPLRVDRKPARPLQLLAGYPVDVEWREDAPFPAGASVQVGATWRGAGDHPEAVLRTRFLSAAPPPGTQSANWVEFVKGILLTPKARFARLHVPWADAYRLTWSTGQVKIAEHDGDNFSGSAGLGQSPEDAIAVDVPATGPAPQVVIPRR